MTQEEFDRFLRDVSVCFTDKNFAGWAACVKLPFTLVAKTGAMTMNTLEELEADFELYLKSQAVMRLDVIARRAISVEICDPDTVIATYETELLSHGARLLDPYISSALIHRTPTGWRASTIINALGHHPWTGKHPYQTGEKK